MESAAVRADARGWLGALGRLALFGLLFFLLAGVLGGLSGWALLAIEPGMGSAAAEAGAEWPLSVRVAMGGVTSLLAAIVAGAVALRLDRRTAKALGFALERRAVRDCGVWLLFGCALLLLAVAPLLPTDLVHFAPDDGGGTLDVLAAFGIGAAVLVGPAAAEEALFRGYPFQVLARAGGSLAAILLSSLAFAWLHGANPEVGPFALLNIFIAGVWLALVYLKTASLWAASAAHLGWNWMMAVVLDLPVSGLNWLDTPEYDAIVGTPAWLTGGAFGPEGGVVATVALTIGVIVLLRMPQRRLDTLPPRARPLFADEAGPHERPLLEGEPGPH